MIRFHLSILFLLVLASCSQKPVVGPQKPEISNSAILQDFSFMSDCSQIRAVNATLWLLTCQKAPHSERTEIYEWSVESRKLRRLTFQDGQIWDIAPINEDTFYYSSSYDEFKEQFAFIVSGAKIGSDIYSKNRKRSEFERITTLKGLEISFHYQPSSELLYFIQEIESDSQIMTLDRKGQLKILYKAKNKTLRNPVWMENSKTLYWVEYDSPTQGPVIKSQTRGKKVSTLLTSDSKIFQLSPSPKSEQLLIGFSTGVGIEVWNLNLTDGCWKLAFRTPDSVSEFYVMGDKNIFLTIKNSLRQDNLFDLSEVCHPSPPGLGVVAK